MSGADRAVEVWCTAPVNVVRERYRGRSRSALHLDLERLATEWENWARNAEIVPTPSDVDVVEVGTFEEVAAFERTSALGWGYPPPSDDDIRSAHRKVTPGSFLAHCAGIPAGTGGFALVEPVTRLWGAAVIPAMRGRGVYRGLVASRLGAAASRDATLALVHAEPASSPILQRLGFRKFGERRTFRVGIDS